VLCISGPATGSTTSSNAQQSKHTDCAADAVETDHAIPTTTSTNTSSTTTTTSDQYDYATDDDYYSSDDEYDSAEDDEFNIIGVESFRQEVAYKQAKREEESRDYDEERLQKRLRNGNAPFKLPYHPWNRDGILFKLTDLPLELFSAVKVLPDWQNANNTVKVDRKLLQECAVELATEVRDSNTAEQDVYTLQQLMYAEQDQKYRDTLGWPPQPHPKNTTFQDLEPWAVMYSNGTVTVDTDKLKAACDYLELQYHRHDYQWRDTPLMFYNHYFSKGKQGRIAEIMLCQHIGAPLILFYLDSSRLVQLSELTSLWDYDNKHELAPRAIYHTDCTVVIENSTLIFEVAVSSLTVRYSEAVRQRLIEQPLILRWIGTAILNKGVLPARSIKMLGHVVVDYENKWNRQPTLTSKTVPDYKDIPITVHNLLNEFIW
jgi:hypothetical protein